MAFGGVTNVEQVGDGQYQATFANGESLRLMGKTGEDAFSRFQAEQSLGARGAVAGPGAGPEAGEGTGSALERAAKTALYTSPLVGPAIGAGKIALETGRRVLGGGEPASKERVGTTTVEAPKATEPAGAAPEAAGEQQQPQPTGPQSLGYTMKGLDPATGKQVEGEAFRMPDGSVQIHQAARPGSPGGLTALGKQTMTQYAEAQRLAAEHSAKASEYQQVGVDLAVQDAEAHQAYLDEQRVQNQLQMQKQADEEAEIQKKVGALEASYQKASQDFREARIDPDRYVKAKPGRNWLLGLSAALGTFGAAMARTPNFAMEFINGQIANDMRSQENEINVKGRDADNQLASLTRSLGDLSLAKKAYRQLKLEEASIESARVSNQFKGQQIANTAKLVSEQSAAEGIKAGEEKYRAFVEHVMKDKLYFRQGSAGSRGGFLVPTQESFQSGRSSNIDVEKLKLQQNKADAAAGKGPHLGQRAQGQIVAARNARSAIHEAADALGVERDETGAFKDPSLGATVASKIPYSDTRQKMNALKLTMIAEIGKAQTGGALTEAEAHEMKDQIDSSNTPGEIGAMLRHYDHTMAQVETNARNVAASSGPGSDNERDDEAH